jgi:hypothetical protein
VRDALRRLAEITGRKINLHGGGTHTGILGIQGREYEMEKPVGTLEAAAPGILPLPNHVQRPLVAMDGQIEQPLGLLLRREVAELLQFNAGRDGLRVGHERRRQLDE